MYSVEDTIIVQNMFYRLECLGRSFTQAALSHQLTQHTVSATCLAAETLRHQAYFYHSVVHSHMPPLSQDSTFGLTAESLGALAAWTRVLDYLHPPQLRAELRTALSSDRDEILNLVAQDMERDMRSPMVHEMRRLLQEVQAILR